MTTEEIKILLNSQKKKSLPLKLFITLNILLAFFFFVFMIIVGVREGSSGAYESTVELQVMPEALNEAGDKPGSENSLKDKEIEVEDEENIANKPIDEKQKKWNEDFQQYAKKISVKNTNLIHELSFDLAAKNDLPINAGDIDVAFEVYDKDKEYLFSFYANYWHEDGYDEGEYWHERGYRDSAYVQFPYAGDFYIVAGIPAGNPLFYQKLLASSGGKVKLDFYSNSKPFPVSSVLGSMFFLTFGIVLIKTRRFFYGEKRLSPYNFIYFNPDFKQFHYIALINNDYYYVNGLTKDPEIKNAIVLILDKDNEVSYLELEREYDDGEFEYYSSLYKVLPEDTFDEIPKNSDIEYNKKKYRTKSLRAAPKKVTTIYANGIQEEIQKTEIVFETQEENPHYLTFEFTDNPEDFDANYGKPVSGFQFWRIKK